jgi:hypothetical protein
VEALVGEGVYPCFWTLAVVLSLGGLFASRRNAS